MKKHRNPVDEFFRESLKDYRVIPSKEKRAAFLEEAGGIVEKSLRSRRIEYYLWLAVILVMLGTGTVLVYYNYQKSIPVPAPVHSAFGVIPTNSSGGHAVMIARSVPELTAGKANTLTSGETGKISLSGSAGNTSVTAPGRSTLPVSFRLRTSAEDMRIPLLAANFPFTTAPPAIDQELSNDQDNKELLLPGESAQVEINSKTGIGHSSGEKLGGMHFSAGVQYTPEWMFNLMNNETKFCNNFGVETAFHFDRFSIRTGLGLSITKGSTEVDVSYNKYLGSVNILDSISFSWDSKSHQYIPTYFTTNTNVYDTLVRYNYTNIEKQYIYFQVPLILGYDFFKSSKVRLGVRIGPVLNLLLNTKQMTAQYDPGKDRIIQVNNVTPDRISTNWQVLGGFNVSVMLTKRFTLEIEPEARYYFNSVYEKSDISDKPWSVGIRTAFLVNFPK